MLASEALLIALLVSSVLWRALAPWAGGTSVLLLLSATVFYSLLLTTGNSARCNCFGDLPSPEDKVDETWRPALLAMRNGSLIALSALVGGAEAGMALGVAGAAGIVIAAGLMISILREFGDLRKEVHPLARRLAYETKELQAQLWWVDGHPRIF